MVKSYSVKMEKPVYTISCRYLEFSNVNFVHPVTAYYLRQQLPKHVPKMLGIPKTLFGNLWDQKFLHSNIQSYHPFSLYLYLDVGGKVMGKTTCTLAWIKPVTPRCHCHTLWLILSDCCRGSFKNAIDKAVQNINCIKSLPWIYLFSLHCVKKNGK